MERDAKARRSMLVEYYVQKSTSLGAGSGGRLAGLKWYNILTVAKNYPSNGGFGFPFPLRLQDSHLLY